MPKTEPAHIKWIAIEGIPYLECRYGKKKTLLDIGMVKQMLKDRTGLEFDIEVRERRFLQLKFAGKSPVICNGCGRDGTQPHKRGCKFKWMFTHGRDFLHSQVLK